MDLLITLGLAKKGNTRGEPFGFELKSLIYPVGDCERNKILHPIFDSMNQLFGVSLAERRGEKTVPSRNIESARSKGRSMEDRRTDFLHALSLCSEPGE
jgi:hypothetical protein